MLKSIIMNYIIACCLVLGEDKYSLIHLSNPFHFSEKCLNKQVASEENCESIFDNIGVICIFGEIVKNKNFPEKLEINYSADLSLKYNSFGHLNFFILFLTAVISDGGRMYQTQI